MTWLYDSQRAIPRIVSTLRGLQAQSRDGWVSWSALARKLTGSDRFVPLVQTRTEEAQYADLFSANNSVVRLSPAGLALIPPPSPPPWGETVGFFVRRYAAELEREVIPVTDCLSRGPVAGGRFLHAFSVESADVAAATETPVLFRTANGRIAGDGRIVGQVADGQIIYVALDQEVLPIDSRGWLLIDRAFLLTKLADSLESLAEVPPLFSLDGVGDPVTAPDAVQVAQGMHALQTPWTRLLWGPPGGGKSHGIGFLVRLLLTDPAERVLLVAPSNKATDVAFAQVVKHVGGNRGTGGLVAQHALFRFGYPRDEDILNRPELLGPAAQAQLQGQVRGCAANLRQLEQSQAAAETLAVARAELIAAQEALKLAVASHVSEARVVATTTALAYSGGLGNATWPTVIVDEVTMVPRAVLAFLASKAERRFLLAGDPQQLGPVYQNGPQLTAADRHWMGTDPFEAAGIAQWNGQQLQLNAQHPRLARITQQRRCPAGVWSYVQGLYPGVGLQPGPIAQRAWLLNLPPLPGEAVPVLDTSAVGAQCTAIHGSWQNRKSAELAVDVANVAVQQSNQPVRVAIITPYRAQVRLIKQLLQAHQRGAAGGPGSSKINVGTVHQFQGSEADYVIFDLVDGPGRNQLGGLLKDAQGLRLVNVAATRTRGKLVILADLPWCQQNNIGQSNRLLGSLIVTRQPAAFVAVSETPPAPTAGFPAADGTESPIEQLLLQAMRQRPALQGVTVQHRICDDEGRIVSRADFAFPEVKLAIYCDGRQWHNVERRWQRDLDQRNELALLGWRFLVFTGSKINGDAPACAQKIDQMRQAMLPVVSPVTPPPGSSPRSRP